MNVDVSEPPPSRVLTAIKRFFVATAIVLLTVNLYTGGPLFAIWLGSRVQTSSTLTMSTVGVVLGTLIAMVALIVWALSRLSATYERLSGNEPESRRTAPWMRSLRDERTEYIHERRPLTGIEKMMVGSVAVAVITFEVWFFFFSGSPIG